MPIVVDHGGAGLIGLASQAGKAKGEAAAGPALDALRQGLVSGLNLGFSITSAVKDREDRKAERERDRMFQLERDDSERDFRREMQDSAQNFQAQQSQIANDRQDNRENTLNDRLARAEQRQADQWQADHQLRVDAAERGNRSLDRQDKIADLQVKKYESELAAEDRARAAADEAAATQRHQMGVLKDALDSEYTDPQTGTFAPDFTYYTLLSKVQSGKPLSADDMKMLPSSATNGRAGYQRRGDPSGPSDLVSVATVDPRTFANLWKQSANAVADPAATGGDGKTPTNPSEMKAAADAAAQTAKNLAMLSAATAQVPYAEQFLPASGPRYFERLLALKSQYDALGIPELSAPINQRVEELSSLRAQTVLPKAIERADQVVKMRTGRGVLESVKSGVPMSRSDAAVFLNELDRAGVTAEEFRAWVASQTAGMVLGQMSAPARAASQTAGETQSPPAQSRSLGGQSEKTAPSPETYQPDLGWGDYRPGGRGPR